MERFYLPILKAKDGEFTALAKLNFTIRNWACPLIEITQPEYDMEAKSKPDTLEEHLKKLCTKISKKWPYDNAFIDIDLIRDDLVNNLTSFEYIYNQFHVSRFYPRPVIRIDSPGTVLDGLSAIIKTYQMQSIGIRITIDDVVSIDFDKNLGTLLEKINLTSQQCHLILDFQNSNFSELEDFTDGVISLLETFPNFSEWRTFTVCGGAFPATNLIKQGVSEIPRGDWMFYKTLVRKLGNESFSRELNYGDYSMIAPGHFEFDYTKMSRSANIRYTHNDVWFVIKGKALKKSEDYRQYVTQAGDIISSQYFLGDNFSEGDHHIVECSAGRTTPGDPKTWKWVGNNHHFTKVIKDLFASPVGS